MADKNKYYNKKDIKDINAEFGRVPPQATELEETVLGALMLEKGSEIQVMDILRPESFYIEAHQKIYKAIVDLSTNHEPIDIYTVTERLKKNNNLDEVGGAFYIAQLTNKVGSGAHLEFHARIIAQKYIQRELIRITSDIQNQAFDQSIDVDDLLNHSEKELFNLAYGNIKNETLKLDTVIKQAIEQIEQASKRDDGLSGVPSGFTSLDRVTSGWQYSDMVIVAARPSMGKTAFVLSMMRNIAVNHNQPVAIFSLEMSGVQLVNRLIVGETELAGDKIKTGNLEDYEWQQLDYKIKNLIDAPLFIDDTPAISLFELRAKCRRLKMQHNIQLVVIDYLQLMTGPPETRGNREQEVSTISRGIKAIAKELSIPIIALSQLNRSVEMRSGDKRPQLSDLRESGAIEQDADIVIFIHRPEKFGITEDEDGNPTTGLAQIIIAKHRNGEVTDVNLRFRAEFARFEEWEDSNLVPLGEREMDVSGVTFSSKMNTNNPKNENLDKNSDPFSSNNSDEIAPF